MPRRGCLEVGAGRSDTRTIPSSLLRIVERTIGGLEQRFTDRTRRFVVRSGGSTAWIEPRDADADRQRPLWKADARKHRREIGDGLPQVTRHGQCLVAPVSG